jgi:general secretion pathway protein G
VSKPRHTRGFTLIELMIVIAILTVLATIVGVSVSGAAQRARQGAQAEDLRNLQNAADLYRHDTGEVAEDIELLDNEAGIDGYRGPYIPSIPDNPLGSGWSIDDTTGRVSPAE